ncbi:MAG: membrane protein insertase YidC [Chromatiales bacterium]
MTPFQGRDANSLMDNLRLLLIISLVFVLMLIWQAWERDYGQPRSSTPAVAPATAPATPGAALPSAADIPSPPSAGSVAPTRPAPGAGRVIVESDVLRVEIGLAGGDLSRVLLRDYPVAIDKPDEPFTFLDDSEDLTFVIQGGLLSDRPAPNHQQIYTAHKDRYGLGKGADVLEVPLTWRSPEGSIEVTKTYTFHRGSHLIDVTYDIGNSSASEWQGRVYGQLMRRAAKEKSKLAGVYTYTGAAISSAEKRYEKMPFDEMKDSPLARDINGGWAGILQHYFVAAVIPPRDAAYHYYTKALDDNRYIVGMYGPPQLVAANASGRFAMRLYAGPKDQDVLENIAPGLDLTVDYGSLWFIAKPLFWLMQKIHGWVGNWGWSIVLLTVLVKAVFYHLAAASYRSMANMKRVQPRLLALRERYANDRQRLNQAMMELYKQEKINPLGGCLPILIQIPVFLALYWVLLESVELRQAPFMGWIRDLSTADPYFVLPLLMGITMYLQLKMNPAPPDPVQAKVMQMLPFIFTVFFAFFPSGLVLYWLVNNILSIGQQWLITRSIEGARAPA